MTTNTAALVCVGLKVMAVMAGIILVCGSCCFVAKLFRKLYSVL